MGDRPDLLRKVQTMHSAIDVTREDITNIIKVKIVNQNVCMR